jgi:hypothetical protein
MNQLAEGHRKVTEYLDNAITLTQLHDWALEFGDDPKQRLDTDSLETAAHVIEVVDDLNHSRITSSVLRQQLSTHINYVATS